jgi:3-oxoacyl-[acyl-carrier protein] reductase
MPGLTLTERIPEVVPAAILEHAAQASPIKRLLRSEEVAATILYVGSAANTSLVGEIIRASGGVT